MAISRRRNAFCTLETHFFASPHSWRAKQRNKQAITRRVSFQGDKKGFVSASRLERASSGSDILFEDKYLRCTSSFEFSSVSCWKSSRNVTSKLEYFSSLRDEGNILPLRRKARNGLIENETTKRISKIGFV